MQEVQTQMLRPPAPLMSAGARLTFQRRFVTLWAWLIRLPN
jgi:hypothetical protein